MFTLFKLVVSDNHVNNKFLPIKCVYDLTRLQIIDGYVMKEFDIITEVFVYITLPELNDGLYWKSNILERIIKSIKVVIQPSMGGNSSHYEEILCDTEYINDLITNRLHDYPDKLLYRNLDLNKKIKMSARGIDLVLPLKLNKKLFLFASDVKISYEINYYDLIENGDPQIENIKMLFKGLSGQYETVIRTDLMKKCNEGINVYEII
jgi:hypothetical protein